jgi:hypothetical protein
MAQLDFLRSSMAAYDAGKEHEAKRLAVPIRTLVHNTRTSTSLLKHLGVQHQLGWLDRGPPEPPRNAIVIAFGLCVVEMRLDTGASRYKPAIHEPAPDRLHPPVSFDDWWSRTVLTDQRGNEFSRGDLVLSLANKDGGAHIDAALDAKYQALARENSLGFMQAQDQPLANSIVHASVRQIAEELVGTLEKGLSWSHDGAVVQAPTCGLRLKAPVTVGRNEPCPCGSGRKMKQCFGRRRPLRVMSDPPADSTAGQVHPLGPSVPTRGQDGPPALILDCLLLVPVNEPRARAA